MILYFKPSDFNISSADIPEKIADKIQVYHIEPMNKVRAALGLPVWPSKRSGWRPFIWEINNGRNGKSQHTFGQKASGIIYASEWGAVDWTCKDFKKNKDRFLELIIEKTDYTRIAVYSTFIHCDYKAKDGKRYIFSSTSASKWTLKETL